MKRVLARERFAAFNKAIGSYYREHKRDMPWRRETSPYPVIVSEIMLQQTQVSRVVAKFGSWMKRFPDWQTLAKAPIKDVLQEWSGLGYNRRALYLKRTAERIVSETSFDLLRQPEKHAHSRRRARAYIPGDHSVGEVLYGHASPVALLQRLPGIGLNTAGSILAFAFNVPAPFIETNIRSVFIHFFFADIEKKEGRRACKKISDDEIMPLIETALEQALKSGQFKDNAREWYWALMDYGAHLKSAASGIGNPSRKSAHHVKQKPFKGSNRELRSKILRSIMERPAHVASIEKQILKGMPERALKSGSTDPPLKAAAQIRSRVRKNVADLIREGFIVRKGSSLHIA